MFTPLPKDFTIERYGLTARLVNESDTEYILSLRTDKKLSKYIHETEDSTTKQLDWFRKYKLREYENRDYYFIYEKDGKPVAVNRVYNICQYFGTPGSWLCSPNNEVEVSMATNFILNDIIFEILQLDFTVFDVRKANKHVWKMHIQCGAKMIGESDIDFYFVTTKQDYFSHRDSFLQLLGLNK